MCCVAGLYRLKGPYDAAPDLEEMRREKEEADREPKVSILSLVRLFRCVATNYLDMVSCECPPR